MDYNACLAAPFLVNKKTQMGAKQQTKAAETLDDAIGNLVRGLKRDLKKKYGRVDYHKLRKDGFSDYLLTRLKRV